MSEGIFLTAWGNRGYSYMSHNLAMSIKHYSPNLPISFMATEGVLKQIPLQFFDNVEVIPEPEDPGRYKVSLYDKFPYDHTLFLDVDAFCLQPVEPLFETLKSSDKPYRCHVYAHYGEDAPEQMPLMYWADKSVIWDHYELSDHELPATQSSLQYIRKGEFCEKLFAQVEENFDDPIPLEDLRNKWGGTQPDELYLNVALAQLRYKPDFNEGIYFGNDIGLNYHQVKEKFHFFSYFGGRGMIKEKFLKALDKENQRMGSKFPITECIPYKHANAKEKPKTQTEVYNPKDGQVILFTSLFPCSPQREEELLKALKNNITNPLIDKIVLLGEKGYEHEKVDYVPSERPTYKDFFELSNKYSGYKILANSDIYFDSSLVKLFGVNFASRVLALSRHDVKANGGQVLFDATGWGSKGYSQDAWIWKGEIKTDGGDFFLGLPGCDNKIAHELSESGYTLNNPARDVKIYHLHNTNERNYTEENRIPEPYKAVRIDRIRQITKKKLLLIQPGKVGDILICLPIAKYFSKEYHVEWLCPREYHKMFKYVDYVRPVTSQISKYEKVIDLSFGLNQRSAVHEWWLQNRGRFTSFVEAKYELAGVPLEERWNLEYNRDHKKEEELYNKIIHKQPYTLVHEWSAYGRPVEMEGVEFKPVEDYTIFDWRLVVENASEIHCIDSSLCNFVEVMDTKAKLFYYKTDRVPNTYDETILLKEWKRIEDTYTMMRSKEPSMT